MDYLEFFNLQEDPFGLTPDSFYFYPSKMHNEVLSSLDYAVEQKEGFSLATGEPGTGKTTILRIFTARWKEKAEVALIMTPRLSGEEFLQAVLEDFGIRMGAINKNELIKAFRDFLIDRSSAGKRVIIIVDEAQNLSNDTLEELRLLSNLETEKEKLLQIVLAGQPELQLRLLSEDLKQLYQRITIRTTLRPFNIDETIDYMRFRLIKAGKGTVTFDDKAFEAIYKFSGGIPRLINLIASRAMMAAYVSTENYINKQHVLTAIKHISDIHPKKYKWHFIPIRYVLMFLPVLIALLAFIIIYNTGQNRLSDKSSHPNQKTLLTGETAKPALRVTVISQNARLKEMPAESSDTIMVAVRGDAFTVIGEWTKSNGNKWYKVRTAQGKEGWIIMPRVSSTP